MTIATDLIERIEDIRYETAGRLDTEVCRAADRVGPEDLDRADIERHLGEGHDEHAALSLAASDALCRLTPEWDSPRGVGCESDPRAAVCFAVRLRP